MTIGSDSDQRRFRNDEVHVPARLARTLRDELRHNADLTQLSPFSQRRWSDALVAETRFQLAAMLNALELAIGLHLADAAVEQALGTLGAGYCRSAIEADLGLLSPDMLGHLRRRAAVAMLLRNARLTNDSAELHVGLSPVETDLLAALRIAEQRWCAPMRLDLPMRPDLPAEHFHELAWTTAALLIQGCEGKTDCKGPSLIRALARATEQLIARHDEGQGAFALARRCARALPDAIRPEMAAAMLREGRLLLFAALVEARTGLDTESAIELLIGDEDADRHALLRLMSVDDGAAFQAAELVAPLAGLTPDGDAGLVRFVEAYRQFDQGQADAWLVRRVEPRVLADKLAMMERSR